MSFIPDKDKAFPGILQAIHCVFVRGGYSGINQGQRYAKKRNEKFRMIICSSKFISVRMFWGVNNYLYFCIQYYGFRTVAVYNDTYR